MASSATTATRSVPRRAGGAAPQATPAKAGGVAPGVGPALAPELAAHARLLWGVCYRMTGSAADADDLVQETFLRAVERPPPRADEPLGPWLMRVAVNLGRDALRRRRRRGYVGPWLPSPVEDEGVASFEFEGEGGTEGRYDLLESVSFAFLLALEVLTPAQRAVLLLRDVFDRSVRETAEALGASEANVKVLHHRARKALAPYEAARARTRPTPALARDVGAALQRFFAALAAGDEAALAGAFAEGAEAWSDGGGEFLAARLVVRGASSVARLYLGLAKKGSPVGRLDVRTVNGVPALVCERAAKAREAPRFVLTCDVDERGRITRLYNVLATRKLAHVAPLPAAG
ncbi:MAG TPA: sigma-70 family RNA polymerase sigma factor [Polyangiaceae bacterium]|nr:sigma-70 family RNA polymerase sigma factor [Polyangiaceae bacterium]